MAQLAYLNGRFVPENELRLSFADAGFVFGATVTDFCRTYQRRLFRWPDHLARLRRDAETCRIPLVQSDSELTAAAEHLVASQPGSDDLAVITFATPGLLGYMTGSAENGPPTLGMHCFPIPKKRYRRFFTEGVELEIVHVTPAAPRHVKHRSRLAWWMAGKTTESDRIPMIPDGPDTAIGAVIGVIDGALTFPEAETVLDSISLKVVQDLCAEVGLPSVRGVIDLEATSELILAGSAFGLAGVRSIGERDFDFPGPVTQKLQSAWSRLVGFDITKEW